jgi:membrane-bound metal-dependent hydrolase YbcI (DUF457 family)
MVSLCVVSYHISVKELPEIVFFLTLNVTIALRAREKGGNLSDNFITSLMLLSVWLHILSESWIRRDTPFLLSSPEGVPAC